MTQKNFFDWAENNNAPDNYLKKYHHTKTAIEIAEKLGCHRASVFRRAKKLGLISRKDAGIVRPISFSDKEIAIINRLAGNATALDIAFVLDRSYYSIKGFAKRHKILLRTEPVYTKDEDDVLAVMLGKKSYAEIGIALKRTGESVRNRCRAIGLV